MYIPKLDTSANIAPTLNAVTNIDMALTQANINDDKIFLAIVAETKQVSNDFTKAYEFIKYESDLEDFDTKRDPLVKSFFGILSGFAHYFDENILNAYLVVKEATKELKSSMTDIAFGDESIQINQLLTICEEQKVRDAIAKLNPLTDVLNRLKQAQQDFDNAYQIWGEAKGRDIKSASKVKKDVINVLNKKLIPYLNVAVLVDAQKYQDITGTIESFIRKANR